MYTKSIVVYIQYGYTNSSNRKKESTFLYIVDDKGDKYLIDNFSSEKQRAYITIAEAQIFGLEGWFKPSGNWTELTNKEVKQIQQKITK